MKINDINYPAGIVCGTVDDAKDFAALAALEIILGTGATNETIEIETHEVISVHGFFFMTDFSFSILYV